MMNSLHNKKIGDTKVAIFLGGPSYERNISLDSARTFFDSIRKTVNEENIDLIFVSPEVKFYRLSHDWIYSNTIEDFEDRINKNSEIELDSIVKSYDAFCPLIHGKYGEDGKLTSIIETAGRRSILGSPSKALALTLNKSESIKQLKELGYKTFANKLIDYAEWKKNSSVIKSEILKHIPSDKNGCWIVKPNDCGSSDGVSLVNLDNLDKAINIAAKYSHQILIEEKIEGREFSLIILQDIDGTVVPLVPTEIEITDYTETLSSGVYSRLKKYMPGSGAKHITPMRIDKNLIQEIRVEAQNIFNDFGMQDWARFDGFLTNNNEVVWSDLNGIPGYGQDSFLFQQASLFGFDHRTVSLFLLLRVLRKEHDTNILHHDNRSVEARKTIAVIGGGTTSEKEVSRMSWLNIFLKLNALNKYKIMAIFQDKDGNYWEVPYFVALQHTVEEIEFILQNPQNYQHAIFLVNELKDDNFDEFDTSVFKTNFIPRLITLEAIAENGDFVFIGLHGGQGEDGTLQKELESLGVLYNGCDAEASYLCMNKNLTNERINQLNIKGFIGPKQVLLDLNNFKEFLNNSGFSKEELYALLGELGEGKSPKLLKTTTSYKKYSKVVTDMVKDFQTKLSSNEGLVLKPNDDGCSSGVIVSRNPEQEVPMYLLLVQSNLDKIPFFVLYDGVDENSEQFLQMPTKRMTHVLIEQFLGEKKKSENSRFIEMTIGVIGSKGSMMALLPSETPSYMGVLTMEEKFCKGVGTNLTPPSFLDNTCVHSIRERISEFANKIGLNGYSRIDTMYDKKHDCLYLLEVNTLPGLTPATIIYTQAILTPELNLKPSEFLDKIVESGFQGNHLSF